MSDIDLRRPSRFSIFPWGMFRSALPRTQLKLVLLLVALVALVALASGVFVERGLREQERAHLTESLAAQARLVQELTHGMSYVVGESETLDRIANRTARQIHARVTLMGRDGFVLGDSDVSLAELPRLENHAMRPEMAAALAGQIGVDLRQSNIVGQRYLYLALPPTETVPGVVRIAVEMPKIEASVAALHRELIKAGILGLCVALVIALFWTAATLRPVEDLAHVVSRFVQGDFAQRLEWSRSTELGEIAGAVNQIAEQLRARLMEIATEKQQLHAILDGMAEGLLVLDLQGRIALVNTRFRDLFHLEQALDVEGSSLLAVVRNVALEDFFTTAQSARDSLQTEIALGEGGEQVLRVQAVGFPRGDARVGTVAVFHDISEIRRLERIRRDFVSNASHELRTPLAAIRGFAETLLQGSSNEAERVQYLEIIDRNARRLTNLVNDLLELARIENRDTSLRRETFALDAIVDAALRDRSEALRTRDLHVDFATPRPLSICSDAQAVEQIVVNLLDNAIKYTDPGGAIHIVLVQATSERVEFSIRDTGIGIPTEEQEKIFERFYRVDQARSRMQGGTGLGLAIVRHLVQQLGGEMGVESKPGQGSCFRVLLPRADAAFLFSDKSLG